MGTEYKDHTDLTDLLEHRCHDNVKMDDMNKED